MSRPKTNQLLYDPRTGSEAIRLAALAIDPGAIEPPRTNYFAIYWMEAGSGEFWADSARLYLQRSEPTLTLMARK